MVLTVERLRELLDYDPSTGVFRWKVRRNQNVAAGSVAGCIVRGGYRHIKIDGRDYKAHRLAWLHVYGEWPPGDLDHKNRRPSHDWIENLRPATQTQNNGNTCRRADNASGFKGVHFNNKKWCAQITHSGKRLHLGYFHTPEAAHAAYAEAAARLFGEFARVA